MANETIEMNGTSVQFVEPCETTELSTINDSDLEEITPGQMVLGTALVGAISIGLWEAGKWVHRRFIVPLAEKIVEKHNQKKEEEDSSEDEELEKKKEELKNKFNKNKNNKRK